MNFLGNWLWYMHPRHLVSSSCYLKIIETYGKYVGFFKYNLELKVYLCQMDSTIFNTIYENIHFIDIYLRICEEQFHTS